MCKETWSSRSLKSVNSNVQMYDKPQFPMCELGDANDKWDRFIPNCGEMVVGAYGDIDKKRPGSKRDCKNRMNDGNFIGPLNYDPRHKRNSLLGCSNFEKPKCAPGNDTIEDKDKVYAYCGHADPDADNYSYGTPIFEFDRTNREVDINVAIRLCDARAEKFNCYHKTGDKAVSYTLPNIPKY